MKLNTFLYNRIWLQNSSLVQLLGLCPVLAMTTNATNAIGLGITTTIVLMCTNTLISLFKCWIPKNIRIPIYMMIIAATVTCIEMLLHAYQLHLYQSLGVFIPLIVTNCIIVARADSIAYKNSVLVSFFDGLLIGFGATLAMLMLGSIRELLGNGTLFFEIYRICHVFNSTNFLVFFDRSWIISLAILPPGGFLILGFLIALKNMITLNKKNVFFMCHIKCICTKKNQK